MTALDQCNLKTSNPEKFFRSHEQVSPIKFIYQDLFRVKCSTFYHIRKFLSYQEVEKMHRTVFIYVKVTVCAFAGAIKSSLPRCICLVRVAKTVLVLSVTLIPQNQ